MASGSGQKELVVPGSFLTTEEEFSSGRNTYEDSEGRVFSSCVGREVFDDKNREVSVDKRAKTARVMQAGDKVIAVVVVVRTQTAVLEIIEAWQGDEEKKVLARSGYLYVANVSNDYLKSLEDAFRLGDIVKATVLEVFPYGAELTTKDPGDGVLKAFCTKDRSPLIKFGSQLKCPKCGCDENRKVAKEYVLK